MILSGNGELDPILTAYLSHLNTGKNPGQHLNLGGPEKSKQDIFASFLSEFFCSNLSLYILM